MLYLFLKELRNEVENFMSAGHDTVASGISWALYNLAKHPDIQERAREEVNVCTKYIWKYTLNT